MASFYLFYCSYLKYRLAHIFHLKRSNPEFNGARKALNEAISMFLMKKNRKTR